MSILGCGLWADEVDWDAELPSPEKEWVELMGRIHAKYKSKQYYKKLKQMYWESHRYYHSLNHIYQCITEFRSAPYLSEHPNEIETAIWFHDAVYNPRAKDNEQKSAELAQKFLTEIGMPGFFIRKVRSLILATKHNKIPKDLDARIMTDIDLSILGKPQKKFDEYETYIRFEYAWVSEDQFRQKRAAVLRGFLERSSIYSTDFFKQKYEEKARANLERAIIRLENEK